MSLRGIAASVLVLLTRLVSGVRAQWIGCEPSVRQRIYFANHSSHLDAVVIWSALPKEVRLRTRPVAARDYWECSALRRYLAREVLNAVIIARNDTRGSLNTIEQLVAAMGSDCSLIFFPEGTRGDGASIGNFKSGLYYLAKEKPEVELVPVYLQNLSRILPKGEFLPVPVLGSATFGPHIRLDPGEAKKEFVQRARNAIIALGGGR